MDIFKIWVRFTRTISIIYFFYGKHFYSIRRPASLERIIFWSVTSYTKFYGIKYCTYLNHFWTYRTKHFLPIEFLIYLISILRDGKPILKWNPSIMLITLSYISNWFFFHLLIKIVESAISFLLLKFRYS